MKTFRVCKLSELPAGSARSIKVLARQIAVFNIEGHIKAFDGLCKHMNAPLVQTGQIKGTLLTCKWHGWQYDIATGACIGKPMVALRQYEVEIQNDEVFVKVETT